ncbi:probable glycerol-3-phosphate acyltransferase 2 [Vigna unguiculata]|uniref:Glycerol-3-phosphate acyltransferase n=1 Tax=Vigna unguiculata TaxID=3917 RepID=A0A4D6MG58_VIGUN|nr:probable glycerol-3-phosphate acyltransferase 2 [Vigna unguiculata]QCE00430.1 glycerol-3-phosphate acyltransferase [Vigna unguiculata]
MSPSKIETVSLVNKTQELSNKTVVFEFESTLLRSTSLFSYFMLVAFEAGGLLRSLILFLSYPLVWLLGEEQHGLKIMVFLCLFGIRKDTFRIGSAVLPKFFLEDVGWEGFEAVMRCERKVALSKLPRVMVEGFLKDYLGVESVLARDIKSFKGYFLGLFEETKEKNTCLYEAKQDNENMIRITGSHIGYIDRELFPEFKKVCLILSSQERRNWHVLPKERYPKPLIFHDGRLAFKPTAASALAFFMWLPFGLFLSIFRFTFGIALPFNVSAPILAFSGTRTTLSRPNNNPLSLVDEENQKGVLYVCNHRTLLDPLYIAYVLDKPLSAVTYSLSRFNELVAPIRTIRLTRDRERDRETMDKLLSLGNLVVCPEGTTCREPYLLRFSPLFAELTDDIVPVAVDVKVTMFYGTTASGHKCLDPFFHFLNPNPTYFVKILDRLPRSQTCREGGKSRIEVANSVQREIGNALGFECTSLTRKDKYMILAGNEGVNGGPCNNCK